jgi:hypothetical protein
MGINETEKRGRELYPLYHIETPNGNLFRVG